MIQEQEKIISKEELAKMLYDTARAKSILANQNALAHNEVLKRTPAWKGPVKEHGNKLIHSLIKAERNEFDKVQLAEETLEDFKGQNVIDQAFEKSNKIILLLARAAFVDYDDVEMILTALAKDKKSMRGIASKILKNIKA